jgi:hypothetical protein
MEEPMNRFPGVPFASAIMIPLISSILAYAADLEDLVLQRYVSETFNRLPYLIFHFGVPIAASAVFLAVAWYVLVRPSSPAYVGYPFAIIGVVGVLGFLSYLLPFPTALRSTVVGHFRSMLGNFGFDSVYLWMSSYLFVVGVVSLARRKA